MNPILKIDHRLVECTVRATGQHFRVTPVRDAGHYDNTDRTLQVVGMQIRAKFNTRGSALVTPTILEKLRA